MDSGCQTEAVDEEARAEREVVLAAVATDGGAAVRAEAEVPSFLYTESQVAAALRM